MENKKVFYSLGLVIIGLVVGFLIWGNCGMKGYGKYSSEGSMHQMPNGEMMHNVGMNMDDMMKGMMASLDGKVGDEFDKVFLSEMIMHHEGAVVMAQAVLKTSKKPELIKLANEIITAQTKEIDMMKGWQKAWFK